MDSRTALQELIHCQEMLRKYRDAARTNQELAQSADATKWHHASALDYDIGCGVLSDAIGRVLDQTEARREGTPAGTHRGTDASTEADDDVLLSWCRHCKSIQIHKKHPETSDCKACKSCSYCEWISGGWEQVQPPTTEEDDKQERLKEIEAIRAAHAIHRNEMKEKEADG